MTTRGPVEQFSPELKRMREEIVTKTGKTPEQLYEEREKRVRDAIELKEPDRVPLWIIPDPHNRYGLSRSAAYYDPLASKAATIKETLYFEPDMCMGGFGTSGLAMEALDVKNKLWPGGPLPPEYEYQWVEKENMKEDEYDLFLSDPSDFVVRRYLPRVYGSMLPLAKLPPVSHLFGSFEFITGLFATPEFEKMARDLSKAGKETEKYRKLVGDVQEELALLGFPAFSHFGGAGGAPFDTLSSFLRGMKGAFLDMYRRPDKLLQALDLLLEQRLSTAVPADPARRGNPKRVGIPLWRGDKNFMSDAQFKKFYWPGLKKAMLKSIELGYIPMPFFEAHFGDRLECLLELPKGKVIAFVEYMDVIEAREILKDHTCVIGKAPPSLRYSPLSEIGDYYKDLIKRCKKGGGFMMNLHLPEKGASSEELKALVDDIKESARY
jgi:uroporphyrinogen-III decarboxylase